MLSRKHSMGICLPKTNQMIQTSLSFCPYVWCEFVMKPQSDMRQFIYWLGLEPCNRMWGIWKDTICREKGYRPFFVQTASVPRTDTDLSIIIFTWIWCHIYRNIGYDVCRGCFLIIFRILFQEVWCLLVLKILYLPW